MDGICTYTNRNFRAQISIKQTNLSQTHKMIPHQDRGQILLIMFVTRSRHETQNTFSWDKVSEKADVIIHVIDVLFSVSDVLMFGEATFLHEANWFSE